MSEQIIYHRNRYRPGRGIDRQGRYRTKSHGLDGLGLQTGQLGRRVVGQGPIVFGPYGIFSVARIERDESLPERLVGYLLAHTPDVDAAAYAAKGRIAVAVPAAESHAANQNGRDGFHTWAKVQKIIFVYRL